MKSIRITVLILCACIASVAWGQQLATPANQYPIDISAEANISWCAAFPNCSTFPLGTHRVNSVTFQVPGSATTNNLWSADMAAAGGSGPVSVTIPVNVANVKLVYIVMNTIWGSTQTGLLTVTFTGDNGATWTFNPVGNVDIRDFNESWYTNSIACRLPEGAGKAATINAWTNRLGQRLDMQIYELPASFKTQTLTSITITDNGAPGVQRGFLAAVTVSTALP